MCDGQGRAVGMCMRAVGQKPGLRPVRIFQYSEATGAHRCGYQRLAKSVARPSYYSERHHDDNAAEEAGGGGHRHFDAAAATTRPDNSRYFC